MRDLLYYLSEKLKDISSASTKAKILIGIFSPVIFLILIFFIFLADWESNKNAAIKFFHPNSLEVNVTNGLQKEKISIKWKTEFFDEYIYIYQNGETVYNEFSEPHENFFLVEYNDKTIGLFTQFKKQTLYGNKYIFSVYSKSESITSNLIVEGEDPKIKKLTQ
jgi:hypothetical protein